MARVLAAEAKKAGSASEETLRIPRPPALTGLEACNHGSYDKGRSFRIEQRLSLNRETYYSRRGCPEQGQQRSVCINLGALSEHLSRIRASCLVMLISLDKAMESSEQRDSRHAERTSKVESGAPRRVALSGLLTEK